MAVFTLNDPYIALSSTDYSQYISAVTLTIAVAEQDLTNFQSGQWTVPLGGRKSGSLALTFNQDVAASQIDSIMWPLVGTTVTWAMRATRGSAKGTSNPEYSGSLLVNGWVPISGSPGDAVKVSVTFPLSGAVTRATA